MMSALRGEWGVPQKQTTKLLSCVSVRVTRGRGSENPKISQTSYVHAPLLVSSLVCFLSGIELSDELFVVNVKFPSSIDIASPFLSHRMSSSSVPMPNRTVVRKSNLD